MRLFSTVIRALGLLAIASAVGLPLAAQHSHSDVIDSNLHFGCIVSGTTAGTVVLSTSGARSATGGVALINNAPTATNGGVHLHLNSPPTPFPWNVILDNGPTRNLQGPGPNMPCTVTAPNPTTGNYPSPNTPAGYNTPTAYVGGTVVVGASQTPGTYTRSIRLQTEDGFGAGTVTLSIRLVVFAGPTISKTADMNFGTLLTSAVAGTCVLSPAGVRTAGGGTFLGSATGVSAAAFNVTGIANATFAITLPGSATLISGANNLTVTLFTSTPSGTTTLSAGGTRTLLVGGRANVNANQPSGTYSGTFQVTVNYT
jgi:hypothetical protein